MVNFSVSSFKTIFIGGISSQIIYNTIFKKEKNNIYQNTVFVKDGNICTGNNFWPYRPYARQTTLQMRLVCSRLMLYKMHKMQEQHSASIAISHRALLCGCPMLQQQQQTSTNQLVGFILQLIYFKCHINPEQMNGAFRQS